MLDDAPILPTTAPELPKPRSFWRRIADRFAAMARSPRASVPPQRSIAFTIAVIALGAKVAKADGRVDRSEVAAFRRIFTIPRGEERNAARVFDLARQDVAGFEEWARRIATMFPPDDPVLERVVEGLVIVASADAALHEAEIAFITRVAEILGLPDETLRAVFARHDPSAGCPPCEVLGIEPGTSLEDARARWRNLIRENHPDRAIAAGLPREAIRLAEARTRAINEAWEQYRLKHVPPAI